MAIKKLFTARSKIDSPAVDVFRWHEEPGALERLTPPLNRSRSSSAHQGFVTATAVYCGSALARSKSAGCWSIAITSKAASFGTCRFQALFILGSTPIPSPRMARKRACWKIASNTRCPWAFLVRFSETGLSGANSGACSSIAIASPEKRCTRPASLRAKSSRRKIGNERIELLITASCRLLRKDGEHIEE